MHHNVFVTHQTSLVLSNSMLDSCATVDSFFTLYFTSGYKMTPPTPGSRSPALPPQSLELFRSPGSSGKGSPASPHLQELSPASSNGSYRAKLQQTSHGLYTAVGKPYALSTPSPSSPGQPYSLTNPSPTSPREREFPSVVRSASRKESFKGLQGPMLVGLERNVSGDSTTTSGSTASTGIVSLSVENSPVTQPAHMAGGVAVGQYPSPPATGSPSFSYSPASFTQPLPAAQVMSGGLVYQVDKSPTSPSGAVMLPPMAVMLGVPNTSPPLHHLPSPHPPPPPTEHLYTDRSKDAAKAEEVPEVLAPPPAFADASKGAEAIASTAQPAEHGHSYPSQSSHSSGAISSSSSYTQSGSIDSGHVLSDESSSTHHSAQVGFI